MLDGIGHTVVGVMPPNFKFWDAQLWVPVGSTLPPDRSTRAGQLGMGGVGRIKPGVTPAQAEAVMNTVMTRLAEQYPLIYKDQITRVRGLAANTGSAIRSQLYLLFGAVACVLLIACVNVTNLLLARGAARERELAVRTALGASRGAIVRQMLFETLPLAVLGGSAGLLLAAVGIRALIAIIPPNLIPAEAVIGLSWPVLSFSAVLALGTSLLAGILPALSAARVDVNESLKESARGSAGLRGAHLRQALVIGEVALALTLLVGAGFLVRGLSRLARTPTGFRTENLVTAALELPETKYAVGPGAEAFITELRERLGRLPGVTHVASSSGGLFFDGMMSLPTTVEGRNYTQVEEMQSCMYNAVVGDYLGAAGIPLVAGRKFTDAEVASGERVVMLNQSAAQRFFPEGDALGRRINIGVPGKFAGNMGVPKEFIDPPWLTVVGITGDARQFSLNVKTQPEALIPYAQSFPNRYIRNAVRLLVRTQGDPRFVLGQVREQVRAMDPDLPLSSLSLMESRVQETLRATRFLVVLLGLFAAVAGILAVVGIYSVVSWMVSQRTREVGIRLALGAVPTAISGLVVRQGLRPVLIGAVVGIGGALGAGRLMRSQLPDVGNTDPVTILFVSTILIGIAGLACWIPARRAAQVDPMIALRRD